MAVPGAEPRRILVVKLGALGNVILSLGPFAAIRRHHPDAHITLLTTLPYADWMQASPWFDAIMVDKRPDWWDVPGWLKLRRRLIEGRFDRAYDLQTSGRSSRYFQLLPRHARPDWSGIAAGCAFPDRDPNRDRLHDIDRQFGQLRAAGIAATAPADLSWNRSDIARFELPRPFALLAPGSSPYRLAKRWPVSHYGQLAAMCASAGMTPVVIGTAPESVLAEQIRQVAPTAIDLTGRTDFADLATLARAASLAVGNDTGTMHLLAAAGCPSLVLFSHDSDPALCAPRSPRVSALRRPNLATLDVGTVFTAATGLAPVPRRTLVTG